MCIAETMNCKIYCALMAYSSRKLRKNILFPFPGYILKMGQSSSETAVELCRSNHHYNVEDHTYYSVLTLQEQISNIMNYIRG